MNAPSIPDTKKTPLEDFATFSWYYREPEEFTAHWIVATMSRAERIAPHSREAALAKQSPYARWLRRSFGPVFRIAAPRPCRPQEIDLNALRKMAAAVNDPLKPQTETAPAERVTSTMFARKMAVKDTSAVTQVYSCCENRPSIIRPTSNATMRTTSSSASSVSSEYPSPASDAYAALSRERHPHKETASFIFSGKHAVFCGSATKNYGRIKKIERVAVLVQKAAIVDDRRFNTSDVDADTNLTSSSTRSDHDVRFLHDEVDAS
ncbi:hypothetical protein EIP91_008277 [Steccherinum ochraceum]|uniref:Uncharacterized protein n=1 Tax=Steccherinum ochraceum TaxID=92696 RepID=A0A4R0R5S8_9APHY|nr:hypothetical protein EIP91_008277 [Steccherinum ochraceum]